DCVCPARRQHDRQAPACDECDKRQPVSAPKRLLLVIFGGNSLCAALPANPENARGSFGKSGLCNARAQLIALECGVAAAATGPGNAARCYPPILILRVPSDIQANHSAASVGNSQSDASQCCSQSSFAQLGLVSPPHCLLQSCQAELPGRKTSSVMLFLHSTGWQPRAPFVTCGRSKTSPPSLVAPEP